MKTYTPKYNVAPSEVLASLQNRIQADGFDYVLDIHDSHGIRWKDSRTGKEFFDLFTCFASMPIGWNHPKIMTPEFLDYLARIAVNKPSNSDIYSSEYATFVETLFKVAIPSEFKYAFFVEGGALANENALKAAFDWKVRQNFTKGYVVEKGHQILHFKRAFHGRSGYTLSLTNTDPKKTDLFPKFNWPRVLTPTLNYPTTSEALDRVVFEEMQSIAEIKQAFSDNKDDIAAIIIEPIQGEGGDNHFRPEFLKALRHLSDENEALLIFDEVQTGVGLTGSMWAFQQLGVIPDILTFGKKMQVCGMVVTDRIDSVSDNVFHTPSRINSTWGGNLVDMVRATKYLEIIEEDDLVNNASLSGAYLKESLIELTDEFPGFISNARGRGLMCAFDFDTIERRNSFIRKSFDEGLILLGCGTRSVRFRPALTISKGELKEGVEMIRRIVGQVV